VTLARRLRLPVVVGLALLVCGVGTWQALDHYVSRQASHGTEVAAVVEVAGSQRLAGDYLMVSYEVDGEAFERRLRSTFTSYSAYEVGQQITVYVDEDVPTRVATADGFSSLGLWMSSPIPLLVFGGVGTILIPLDRWLKWRKVPAPIKRGGRVPELSVQFQTRNLFPERVEVWGEIERSLQDRLHAKLPDREQSSVPRVLVKFIVGGDASSAGGESGASRGRGAALRPQAVDYSVAGFARKVSVISVEAPLPSGPPPDWERLVQDRLAQAVATAEQYARKSGLANDLTHVRRMIG
jgi:hypothetical protein